MEERKMAEITEERILRLLEELRPGEDFAGSGDFFGEGLLDSLGLVSLGGIALGVIEQLAKQYISDQLSNAIVFLVLILVLLIRPTGLFGRKISEKV